MLVDLNDELWDKVFLFFGGSAQRTWLWFETSNPLLGNISPQQMIEMGREDKLLAFINESLNENKKE